MSKTPPNHRLGQMLILDLDAFDNDRVLLDIEGIEDEPDKQNDHPVIAYRQGKSRFDLDAPGVVYTEPVRDSSGRFTNDESCVSVTARDYLKGNEDEHPVFECRRLATMEISTCLQRGEEVGAVWAFHLACKAVHNTGIEFRVPRRKPASDAQVQAVHDALGYDVIPRVGRMILNGSREPTSAEKKPSGS